MLNLKKFLQTQVNPILLKYVKTKTDFNCYSLFFILQNFYYLRLLERFDSNHYLCVTSHCINDEQCIQKRIITFRKFEFAHTAQKSQSSPSKYFFSNFRIEKNYCLIFYNVFENMTTIKILKNYTRTILNKKLFHVYCIYLLTIELFSKNSKKYNKISFFSLKFIVM